MKICRRLVGCQLAAAFPLPSFREVEVQLLHREFCKSLFLDLVVAEQAVCELKVVKAITDAHIGQLLTYLHLHFPTSIFLPNASPCCRPPYVSHLTND